MKKVLIFSGIDKFNISFYRSLFYTNKHYRKLLKNYNNISGSNIEQKIILGDIDYISKDFSDYCALFTLAQITFAKDLETKIGPPDIIITHSIGEVSALMYSGLISEHTATTLNHTAKPITEYTQKGFKNFIAHGKKDNVKKLCADTNSKIMATNTEDHFLICSTQKKISFFKKAKNVSVTVIPTRLIGFPVHTDLLKDKRATLSPNINLSTMTEQSKSRFLLYSFTKEKPINPDENIRNTELCNLFFNIYSKPMNFPEQFKKLHTHHPNENFQYYVIDESGTYLNFVRNNLSPDSKIESVRESLKWLSPPKLIKPLLKLLPYRLKLYDKGSELSEINSLDYLRD